MQQNMEMTERGRKTHFLVAHVFLDLSLKPAILPSSTNLLQSCWCTNYSRAHCLGKIEKVPFLLFAVWPALSSLFLYIRNTPSYAARNNLSPLAIKAGSKDAQFDLRLWLPCLAFLYFLAFELRFVLVNQGSSLYVYCFEDPDAYRIDGIAIRGNPLPGTQNNNYV